MKRDFFAECVKSTLELIAIDSVQDIPAPNSPFGKGVGDALEYVRRLAEQLGFSARCECGYYVTADVGEGDPFAVLGHVDTVPYGSDWSADPLGDIRDGILYGRGALDDKGPILLCLFAAAELLAEGRRPKRRLRFVFGGNEESGWKCIERYCELEAMPAEGFSPDADFPVIHCEKGLVNYDLALPCPEDLLEIAGGTRANIVMSDVRAVVRGAYRGSDRVQARTLDDQTTELTARGKPAHASTPREGDNALWHLLRALAAQNDAYKRLADLLCHSDGSGAGIRLSDPKSGALTFNAGKVWIEDCKENCGDVSRKLHFLIDIRYPVSYTKEEIMERLRAAFAPCEIAVAHYHDPHYVSPDAPLVRKLLRCYEEVVGEKAQPVAIGGGTYARALRAGVAFGPIFPNTESTIHQKDERVALDDFRKMYEIYRRALEEIVFS